VARIVLVLTAVLCLSHEARAQTERERALEDRVHYLEERLRLLEQHLNALDPAHAAAPAAGSASESTASAPAPAVAVESAGQPNPARADDVPQETFVFRENAVTLKPKNFEISGDVGYSRGSGVLQFSRAFTATLELRAGIRDWLEVGAVIPTFTSTRSQIIGPFLSRSRHLDGLGDPTLQANARLWDQGPGLPGAVLSFGVIAPAGPNPYRFTFYQPDPGRPAYNPNPTDLTASYFSRGTWGLTSNLQLYKTVDPLILFLGVGMQTRFSTTIENHDITPGRTYTYNAGFSLALSEKSTFGFQVNGAYDNKLHVDHVPVPESNLEAALARISLIQRVYQNTFVEPSITAGLGGNAPDVGLNVGVRHRF